MTWLGARQARSRQTTKDEISVTTAVLGSKAERASFGIEDFDKRIVDRGGPVVVLNDEAHHTHDEDSEWNKVIRGLHTATPGAQVVLHSLNRRPPGRRRQP